MSKLVNGKKKRKTFTMNPPLIQRQPKGLEINTAYGKMLYADWCKEEVLRIRRAGGIAYYFETEKYCWVNNEPGEFLCQFQDGFASVDTKQTTTICS